MAQNDRLLPQISGGKISELLEPELPVSRHDVFLNLPVLSLVNF